MDQTVRFCRKTMASTFDGTHFPHSFHHPIGRFSCSHLGQPLCSKRKALHTITSNSLSHSVCLVAIRTMLFRRYLIISTKFA